ncbi:MAG TPA: transglycosylase SLT domain-containing protein [Kofleriaceae bacterium]|nr:transglycosylase SLT domain-containing protein [Kofleriaceae bacterium]
MLRPRLLAALFLVGELAASRGARAGGDPGDDGHQPVVPGRQASPPSPSAPEAAPLEMDEGQRRAIRGCRSDGRDCADDLLPGLLEFEREAFPRPSAGSPWSDDEDAAAGPAASAGIGTRARRTVKPTDLRPDLPWLAGLEMPDLPMTWDLRVIRFLEFYRDDPRGQRLMREWLTRQGRYRDMIVRRLRAAHLPEDLLYVAMIESSYDPLDRSRVGASGLWQFMPGSGLIYGLRQTTWIDERNDPLRATDAVIANFADLYQRFGNWDLAMAAFNCGYGAVLRAIAKYNTNDFWLLLDYESALPWESSIYVPKALAAAIVGKNREAFGFGDVTPAAPLSYDEVTVPTSVSLAVIARAAGSDARELEELNPQLRRGRTPPGLPAYTVRIPRGRKDRFAATFAQLRGDWDRYDAYVVRHGERFEDIAAVHGLKPSALRELNGLDSDREVQGGTLLVVPRVADADKRANRVRADQELYAAGEPEGRPGEKMLVALADPSFRVPGRRRVFYRVVGGDSLTRVASSFAVDRVRLAEWNRLDAEARLQPRMVLQIWVEPGFDPERAGVSVLDAGRIDLVAAGSTGHMERAENLLGRARATYRAQRRESYEQIGRRFGLSPRDLARINKKPFDTVLAPGESCVVYKVVDRRASERAEKQARAARPERRRKATPRPRQSDRKTDRKHDRRR